MHAYAQRALDVHVEAMRAQLAALCGALLSFDAREHGAHLAKLARSFPHDDARACMEAYCERVVASYRERLGADFERSASLLPLCPSCIAKIGGACAGPDQEYRAAFPGEACGAADHEAPKE